LPVEIPTKAALAINRDDADVVARTEEAYSSGNVCGGSIVLKKSLEIIGES
jgi:hypothetical protein